MANERITRLRLALRRILGLILANKGIGEIGQLSVWRERFVIIYILILLVRFQLEYVALQFERLKTRFSIYQYVLWR